MNLFPTITKFDLTHGRTRMAGRKQRIKKYMENTQQWIPLTGPGGRLPTAEDGDDSGTILITNGKRSAKTSWSCVDSSWTHFCPIPKAPPLPKPVEKTQDEKDQETAGKLYDDWMKAEGGARTLAVAAIRYGRSDGRAQLAREAIALLHSVNLDWARDVLKEGNCFQSLKVIDRVEELLTKAAEAKP